MSDSWLIIKRTSINECILCKINNSHIVCGFYAIETWWSENYRIVNTLCDVRRRNVVRTKCANADGLWWERSLGVVAQGECHRTLPTLSHFVLDNMSFRNRNQLYVTTRKESALCKKVKVHVANYKSLHPCPTGISQTQSVTTTWHSKW